MKNDDMFNNLKGELITIDDDVKDVVSGSSYCPSIEFYDAVKCAERCHLNNICRLLIDNKRCFFDKRNRRDEKVIDDLYNEINTLYDLSSYLSGTSIYF